MEGPIFRNLNETNIVVTCGLAINVKGFRIMS